MKINYELLEKFETIEEFYNWFYKYKDIDYDKCLKIYNRRYIQAIKLGHEYIEHPIEHHIVNLKIAKILNNLQFSISYQKHFSMIPSSADVLFLR